MFFSAFVSPVQLWQLSCCWWMKSCGLEELLSAKVLNSLSETSCLIIDLATDCSHAFAPSLTCLKDRYRDDLISTFQLH